MSRDRCPHCGNLIPDGGRLTPREVGREDGVVAPQHQPTLLQVAA